MPDTDTHVSYVFGRFRLQPDKRQLLDSTGRDVPLRGKVFDLLWFLLQRRGELVGKAELLDTLWPDTVVEENNLTQAVSALRHALGSDGKSADYIVTVKGRGYQFVGDVTVETAVDTVPLANKSLRNGIAVLILAMAVTAVVMWVNRDSQPVPTQPGVIEHFADATLSLVTDYAGSHSEPTLSPDGNRMAYVSDISGTAQIWVKNLQRGDPVQLSNSAYPAVSPSWSPNDDQLIFEQQSPGGPSIYSIDPMGSTAVTLVADGARAPSYSSQVDAFVFTRGQQIWIARNGGRDRSQIIGIPASQGFAAREPALSPDGSLVAFVHADEGPLGNLWVIPATGGEARQLTTQQSSGGIVAAPAWSSDGKYIVYSVEASMGGGQMWRIAVDSGEFTALTSGAGGARDATLSRDGSRLAYTSTRIVWKLTRIDPVSGAATTVHDSRAPLLLPVIAPDGRRIVYFTRSATGMQIVTIDSDGENLQQRTFDEAGENTLPTWGGNNESILYYRGRSLHRLHLADGSDERVFADFHWSDHIWVAAHGNRITWHFRNHAAGERRTIVREFGESAEVELPLAIEGARWSADGSELLGYLRQTGELFVCAADGSSCHTIERNGESILGMYPAWSADGKGVYYLRRTDGAVCCSVWRVDLDGARNELVAELADFDGANSYFGIDADGNIVYNHSDRSSDEIWLADYAR